MTTIEDDHLPNGLTLDSMTNCIHVTVEMYAHALARAERAEAELEKCKKANDSWTESYCQRHNDSIEQRERAERAETKVAELEKRLADTDYAWREAWQAWRARVKRAEAEGK